MTAGSALTCRADARYGDILEDGAGRLWLAASTGMLYRHDDTDWRGTGARQGQRGWRVCASSGRTMYLAYNRSEACSSRPDDTVEDRPRRWRRMSRRACSPARRTNSRQGSATRSGSRARLPTA
ncbi:MAG: hypothetical protein R2854_12065 [Caldilineaceae bacterium]